MSCYQVGYFMVAFEPTTAHVFNTLTEKSLEVDYLTTLNLARKSEDELFVACELLFKKRPRENQIAFESLKRHRLV